MTRQRRRPGRILLTAGQIRRRIRALVEQISRDYEGRDLVVVAVLKGSVVFLADLIRHFERDLSFDFVGMQSYGCGTTPARRPRLTKSLTLDIRGRNVLVVDDILDTGRTFKRILEYLRRGAPAELRSCVLLDKRARRAVAVEPDYCGFEIDNVFVVGYGLDYADRYRNLPHIAALRNAPRQRLRRGGPPGRGRS